MLHAEQLKQLMRSINKFPKDDYPLFAVGIKSELDKVRPYLPDGVSTLEIPQLNDDATNSLFILSHKKIGSIKY